jgi:hypothetical protein
LDNQSGGAQPQRSMFCQQEFLVASLKVFSSFIERQQSKLVTQSCKEKLRLDLYQKEKTLSKASSQSVQLKDLPST